MSAINFSEQLLEFAELETLYGAASASASALLHELEKYQGINQHTAQTLTHGDRWEQVFEQMCAADAAFR